MFHWIRFMFLKFLNEHPNLTRGGPVHRINFTPQSVWDLLAAENQLALIDRLRRVERGEPGYRTVLIPNEGFSKDPKVHQAVLDWLRDHNVNVYNCAQEIAELADTL